MEKEKSDRLCIDTKETPWVEVYRCLTDIVVPRPIALVSTVDENGRENLAPFSFFTVVSSNPPYVAFSPHRAGRSGEKKDTLRNVETVGEFVVSVVTEEIAERVNTCAASLPYGESEFELSGLTPAPADTVRPPLVAESPANLECELVEIHSYGEQGGAGSLVVGCVKRIHVDSNLLNDNGRVVADRLKAVGRMGGNLWARTLDTMEMERPE